MEHFHSALVCPFCWVNGLHSDILFDWHSTKRISERDSAAHKHMQKHFDYFKQGRQYILYARNVANGRYEWLDGSVRRYYSKYKQKMFFLFFFNLQLRP